jgi:thymidylate kinase
MLIREIRGLFSREKMSAYVGSRLILVEGLTGSGKSIMAHFIARQLQYNGIPASWVHEGEEPHPILVDVGSSLPDYMDEMRERWAAYVEQAGDQVIVVEACLFNNLIDSLLAHDVDRAKVLQYGDALQALIEPLNPTLVYLVQEDVDSALERNFKDRGKGFRDYVIQYATETPLARRRGWEGYAGMVMFWREFVAVTDELFQRYRIRKLKIDNSAGHWDDYNRQVLECLSLPLIPEQVSQSEALGLVGVYRDRKNGREFTVRYEEGKLTINLFLSVRTPLVRRAEKAFLTEGWHFELSFETDGVMRIGGRDVDYLQLVGTVADKVCA